MPLMHPSHCIQKVDDNTNMALFLWPMSSFNGFIIDLAVLFYYGCLLKELFECVCVCV